jgi:hypothetical protein
MNFVRELLDTNSGKGELESKPQEQSEQKKSGKTRKVFKYGSRRQVFNGSAEMTVGGLRKDQLLKNEKGRIVSSAKHKTMKQRHTD